MAIKWDLQAHWGLTLPDQFTKDLGHLRVDSAKLFRDEDMGLLQARIGSYWDYWITQCIPSKETSGLASKGGQTKIQRYTNTKMGILQRWHSELQDVAPLPITYAVLAELS